MLVIEYWKFQARPAQSLPFRAMLYTAVSITPLLAKVTAIAGVLYLNAAIFDVFAWRV